MSLEPVFAFLFLSRGRGVLFVKETAQLQGPTTNPGGETEWGGSTLGHRNPPLVQHGEDHPPVS